MKQFMMHSKKKAPCVDQHNKGRRFRWITTKNMYGGAKRDRTADLLNAIQALSQLSYSPSLLS